MFNRLLGIAIFILLFLASAATSVMAQSHVALVIGNSAYQTAPAHNTAAADATAVAETLRGAGYDVTDLRDVRQADIGRTMRDFLDKAAAAGPEGVAFFYFAGYAAQSDRENYLVPVDAAINRNTDVAAEAFRLNDLIGELATLQLAARIIVLDASRDTKFGSSGDQPAPKGLAIAGTVPGMLIAFAAAPGAATAEEAGPYSLYTSTLVTLMRQPGLDIEQVLKTTQLQVNKATAGAQAPWTIGNGSVELTLFDAPVATPTPPAAGAPTEVIDLSNLTCKTFLAGLPEEISHIIFWLDAYYKDQKDRPIIDSKALVGNAKRLAEYCAANPKVGLINATDKLLRKRVNGNR